MLWATGHGARMGSGRLRFIGREIILRCFQIRRTDEWARAHFFVGGEQVATGVEVPVGRKPRP